MKWLTCSALVVVVAACGVPKKNHQRVLAQLAKTEEKLSESERDSSKKAKHIKRLEAELSSTQAERDLKDADGRDKQKRIKEKELRIEKLMADMKATREQLLKVQEQQTKAEERLAAFRKLNDRFRKLVSAGALKVSFRNGQMVLLLPSEVLFGSGKADLSRAGKEALAKVLDVLKSFRDRRFLVAGHTDNQRIRSRRFKSNWELSTARAVSVVRFMIEGGFEGKNLGAAGYGAFDPVAPNDSDTNRAKNRRIEIILVPDLSELPNLNNPS